MLLAEQSFNFNELGAPALLRHRATLVRGCTLLPADVLGPRRRRRLRRRAAGRRSRRTPIADRMRAVKAAVYYETGPPDVFRYEDVPDPVCPPGCVLIEVEAISIEGGDTLNRAGGVLTATPHIVGYQCAGTIREVGAGVTDRHVGQRVVATMVSGSHAELVAVPRS